jgi:hypothetical protein
MRANHGHTTFKLDRALQVFADAALVVVVASVLFALAGGYDEPSAAPVDWFHTVALQTH